MSEVRRYRATVDWEEHDYGAFVRYDDYFALLAVLRRCVTWMGGQFCPEDTNCANCREGREVVSAAREYLEDTP